MPYALPEASKLGLPEPEVTADALTADAHPSTQTQGWAVSTAGGLGPMLSAPSQFGPGMPKEGQFWSVFWPAGVCQAMTLAVLQGADLRLKEPWLG